MLFLDTETCGFHGPIVLIQYAEDKGNVQLHHVWKETIYDTLKLIEWIVNQTICGFNISYDWFHLQQSYTTLLELGKHIGQDKCPEDYIDSYANCESVARNGPCLKPVGALDLLLYARKGPYQSTMDRRNIVIKRVPIQLAERLINVLEEKVQLKDIYFSRRKDQSLKKWQIQTIKGEKNFVNVVLKFAASSALKVLAADALGHTDILRHKDINLPKKFHPVEVGWAPFATAISSKEKDWKCTVKLKGQKKTGYTWPGVIREHINHWYYDELAKKYGTNDVLYLQELYDHFKRPEPNDTDSIIACMVGSVRWRGFAIDKEKLTLLRNKAIVEANAAPKAPHHVYRYLTDVMDPTEKAVFDETGSTKKVVLEKLSKELVIDCSDCKGVGCEKCDKGTLPHPAALRAKACLDARQAKTKINNFDKLLTAGRFHVSVNVIGALSGRISGRDGLNATGIQHEKTIRSIFTLAAPGYVLCGGDFVSYEVAIADARYNDEELRKQLLTCWFCNHIRTLQQYEELYCPGCENAQTNCEECKSIVIVNKNGKIVKSCSCRKNILKNPEDTLRKIHGLFAMSLYPGETYEQVLSTKGTKEDHYDYGKRGLFSQLYGGNYNTLMTRLGIDEETAHSAEISFAQRFPGVGRARKEIADKFCSMRQPKGIGTQVIWNEPHDYVESLNSFRRHFTLENKVCKILFDLANDPPEEWTKLKLTCVRRDREQKVGGAVRSALFAAAFNIQSKNMRAAANHEIQSTGAIETKELQRRIWDLQPVGINDWFVQPFQVHDEIMCPTKPEVIDNLSQTVKSFVKEKKSLIPLLRIDWSNNLKNWSEK